MREPPPLAPADVVVFAGLPGTGKSTLARELARRLGAPRLDKDEVRARLFGRYVVATREQDDVCCALMYGAAARLVRRGHRPVLLDGRCYVREGQVEALAAAMAGAGLAWAMIRVDCRPAIALQRLANDAAAQAHLARDRDADLYRRLAALRRRPEPPPGVPVLDVDTSDGGVERCIAEVLRFSGRRP